MINDLLFYDIFSPLPVDYDLPPTIYAILNSYVNFDNDNPVKIKNLASAGREVIFDFDYPLTANITKENFEVMILNNYLMRRIGYETLTAFKIALCVKLNEIMPKYNKLFDSFINWNLFSDGEVITRNYSSNISNTGTNTGSSSNISDRRFSDLPQNQLTNIQNGSYVTEYNYDTDTASTNNSLTNTGTEQRSETENRTLADKESLYKNFASEINNVYTLIFKELDPLFYGLV